jgi:hypothetical protein
MNTSNTTKLIHFDYLFDVLSALSFLITFLSCQGASLRGYDSWLYHYAREKWSHGHVMTLQNVEKFT